MRKIDYNKVQELALALKQIIMLEPELEAKIAVDKLLLFSRKPEFWAKETPEIDAI